MTRKELYRLPTFGRMEYRGAAFQAVGLYLAAIGLLAWFFTQRFADQFGFDPALGEPWLTAPAGAGRLLIAGAAAAAVGALAALSLRRLRRAAALLFVVAFLSAALARGPLYTPVHLLAWAWRYRHTPEVEPLLSTPLSALVAAAGVGALALFVYLAVQASRLRERGDIHGSAHWATDREVQEAGLLANTRGVLLGLWSHRGKLRYLRHDGPEHVFVFAPTRTGKGVGLVLPNLLTCPTRFWSTTSRARTGPSRPAGAGASSGVSAYASTRRTPRGRAPATTRCRRSAWDPTRCATRRTSPTSWSTRTATGSATTGTAPPTRSSSASSSTSSTPKGTRACAAAPTSSRTPAGRWRRRSRR